MHKEEIKELLFDALISTFSNQMEKNPKWNFNDYYKAWECGKEYNIPEFVRRPMQEMRKDTCTTVFTDTDGHNSISLLTYEDVVDAIVQELDTRGITLAGIQVPWEDLPVAPPGVRESIPDTKAKPFEKTPLFPLSSRRFRFRIYSAGYAATGEWGPAYLFAEGYGNTFEEACQWLKDTHYKDDDNMYKREGRWYYWGCGLFDNIHDAIDHSPGY